MKIPSSLPLAAALTASLALAAGCAGTFERQGADVDEALTDTEERLDALEERLDDLEARMSASGR
jgi:hypothetical protein